MWKLHPRIDVRSMLARWNYNADNSWERSHGFLERWFRLTGSQELPHSGNISGEILFLSNNIIGTFHA